ncbi:hypothetical protein K438DRAFT_1969559 [Mycena galopus ATCC 62051]|nr:hypothetical protein K438DRAFT_1969559 [Mycena galopus ATCC 62051]
MSRFKYPNRARPEEERDLPQPALLLSRAMGPREGSVETRPSRSLARHAPAPIQGSVETRRSGRALAADPATSHAPVTVEGRALATDTTGTRAPISTAEEVVHELLGTSGDVYLAPCHTEQLLPLYFAEMDPCSADDPIADFDAMHPRHFKSQRRSARLAAKQPGASPSPAQHKNSMDHSASSSSSTQRKNATERSASSSSPPTVARSTKRKRPELTSLPQATKRYLNSDGELVVRELGWSEVPAAFAELSSSVQDDHAPKSRHKPGGTKRGKRRPTYTMERIIKKATVVSSCQFSLLNDVPRSASGFQGALPPPIARKEIDRLYRLQENGTALHPHLAHFFPAPYDMNQEHATFFVDRVGQIFMYRTYRALWLKERASEVHYAVDLLAGPSIRHPGAVEANRHNTRGPHIPIIIGHHRQSAKAPLLSAWHKQNQARVEDFLKLDIVQRIIEWVASVVTDAFPGVAARFKADAEWHERQYGIRPLFGLFWNFCLNAYIPAGGQLRSHSYPHGDTKNQIGVCALLVHVLKGFENFNHTKRTWLVLWEAGIVVELPPWSMAIYPSALFYHFNIDVHDIQFVTTEGDVRPTPTNSRPIIAGDEEGRSSMVFFNQATMHHEPATGFPTLKEAKANGHSGRVDFGTDANAAFNQHVVFRPMPERPTL